MDIFGKKWFRLIIFLVLLVATFGAGFGVMITLDEVSTDYSDLGTLFGMFTVVGQLFLFIAFDMLYDVDNVFLRFLRMLFIILGVLVFLGLGLTSGFLYAATSAELSPWLKAFGGLWLSYGVISFYLYYFADYRLWTDGIVPFIQIIAFAGAYFVTVIFAYVGDSAGAFFYAYPSMILCAVAFIVMCIILKKKGLPFDNYDIPHIVKNSAKPAPAKPAAKPEEESGQQQKKRKDAFFELFDPLEKATKTAISRAVASMRDGIYGRIRRDNTSKIQHYVVPASMVKVYGEVYYETNGAGEGYQITDEINEMQDSFNEKIKECIDEEVEKLKEDYFNYDNFNNSSRKSEVKVRRIK